MLKRKLNTNEESMKIKVKEQTAVRPMPEKPRTMMWISNLDAIMLVNRHISTHWFYRSAGTTGFFNTAVLTAALARTLSEFYPMAGRLKKNDKGRIEIDCNGEGAVIIEAEADGELDDLGDFAPRSDICFAPTVDYSQGISSFPLFLVQVTRFKCGGVCLGTAMSHLVCDGFSAMHLMSTWCGIARGLNITVPPHLDRRVLAARSQPQPKFKHVEYQLPPLLKSPPPNVNAISEKKFSVLKLSREQLNTLKAKCEDDDGRACSSFVALAGHIWKCMCQARGLAGDQETRFALMVDGRSRLQPPLPRGYFGNAIFIAAPTALSGELIGGPLKFAAAKITSALARMDDEYLRSAIDYLEVHGGPHPSAIPPEIAKSPNLYITSWARLPFYAVDFGWGTPFYIGLTALPVEGRFIVMPTPINDDGLSVALTLPEDKMKLFQTVFYDI